MIRTIAHARLLSQQIAHPRFQTPGEVVAWLGAVQAQEYLSALWAIGLRLPAATEAEIEQAVVERTIVRTWPMRGTLHFVAAADLRWMLELLTPRVLAGAAARRKQLEIDEDLLAHSRDLIVGALEGGRQETREQLMVLFEAHGISTAGQRGIHILGNLTQSGLLCFGPHQGRQPTFVLLDEWLPNAKRLDREEALAALALRYFTGHGPATVQDFVWWTGLTMADARAGLGMVAAQLVCDRIDGVDHWSAQGLGGAEPDSAVHLLPSFDEYLLGYRNRDAVLEPDDVRRVHPGENGVFKPIVVVDGRVAGIWRKERRARGVKVSVDPFTPLSPAAQEGIEAAAERYQRFLGATA